MFRDFIVKIKWWWDPLILINLIHIPVRRLYIEPTPRSSCDSAQWQPWNTAVCRVHGLIGLIILFICMNLGPIPVFSEYNNECIAKCICSRWRDLILFIKKVGKAHRVSSTILYRSEQDKFSQHSIIWFHFRLTGYKLTGLKANYLLFLSVLNSLDLDQYGFIVYFPPQVIHVRCKSF